MVHASAGAGRQHTTSGTESEMMVRSILATKGADDLSAVGGALETLGFQT